MNEALIAAVAAALGAAVVKGVDLFISFGKARQEMRKSDQDYVIDQYRRLIDQLQRELDKARGVSSPEPEDIAEVKRRVETIARNVTPNTEKS